MAELPFAEPLIPGTLIKRYKRFFVDVRLDTGEVVVAHTPNTGSMKSCSAPGSRVYLSPATNPERKLKYTLEIVDADGTLVGVNTQVPNRLVAESIAAGDVAELTGYDAVRREVRLGKSRIDIALGNPPNGFVEIKNVSLVDNGRALFPDAVSARAQKHLMELLQSRQAGHRSVIFFLVQRADCRLFAPADAIDPEYGRILRYVVERGVEALAYRAEVTPVAIALGQRMPIEL